MAGGGGEYRYLATSVEGFVQQCAVSYLKNRYWFYVLGEVPADKDPVAVDEKLLLRYGVARSKWAKARAAKLGEAKVQYLRFDRTFLLMATHGRAHFFEAERVSIRDARDSPIKFYGYSLSYRDGHPHVRIGQAQYRQVTDALLDVAARLPPAALAAQVRALPFEPYAPVQYQLKKLLFKLNRARKAAGLPRVPAECVRTKRRVVRPFELPASGCPADPDNYVSTGVGA